jgi:hypothetical protein
MLGWGQGKDASLILAQTVFLMKEMVRSKKKVHHKDIGVDHFEIEPKSEFLRLVFKDSVGF